MAEDFDTSAVIADLTAMQSQLASVGALLAAETESTQQQARAAAKTKAGAFQTAIRSKVFHNEGGETRGSVFVIQLPWIRNLQWQKRANPTGNKLWPKLLPKWREDGTSRSPAHPYLYPAFEAGQRRLDRAVEAVLAGFSS